MWNVKEELRRQSRCSQAIKNAAVLGQSYEYAILQQSEYKYAVVKKEPITFIRRDLESDEPPVYLMTYRLSYAWGPRCGCKRGPLKGLSLQEAISHYEKLVGR